METLHEPTSRERIERLWRQGVQPAMTNDQTLDADLDPSESDALADLTPGSTVGPYVILDRLGRGGMGQVFLANDSRLRRKVALKCLLSRRNARDLQSQILREARAAARITHPNVAAVHDVIEHGTRVFIVMEYVEGENLSARLKRERLPIGTVIAIGRQLASALGAAHARGVVHRDLKPANIQVALDGSVKVVDFGVAAAVAAPATVTAVTAGYTDTAVRGLHAGTPGYMSPEQLFGRDAGPRSDIFSLGIVMFELATGQRLFADNDTLHIISALAKPLPRADAIAPGVPPRLSDVIARALETDPGRRIQSAADFESALAEIDQVRDAATMTDRVTRLSVTPVAAGGEGVHALRGRLILAQSQPDLLRLKYEVERYLATRPHDVDGRVLRDDVDRAIGARPSSARGRRLDFVLAGTASLVICAALGISLYRSAPFTSAPPAPAPVVVEAPRSFPSEPGPPNAVVLPTPTPGSMPETSRPLTWTAPGSAAREPRPPVSAPLAPPPSSVSEPIASGADPARVAPLPATDVEMPGIPRRPGEAVADYLTRSQATKVNLDAGKAYVARNEFALGIARLRLVAAAQKGYQGVEALIADAETKQRAAFDQAMKYGQDSEQQSPPRFSDALKWYLNAQAIDPNAMGPRERIGPLTERMTKDGLDAFTRAEVFRRRNDTSRAIESYTRAVEFLPRNHVKSGEARKWLETLKP